MGVSFYSVLMTFLWSSLLISIFYLLRSRSVLLDVCSVYGVIILYLFCIIRMFIPIELPWTKIINGGNWYNTVWKALYWKLNFGIQIKFVFVLLSIWILGAAIFLFRYLRKYVNAARFFNRLPYATDERLEKILSEVCGKNKRIPKVCVINVITTPCCVGILHKKILIPGKPYSDEELYHILLHEYSHLQNNDILTILLINILCAIYWWNPFVQLLNRDLNQSLEIRCDISAVHNMDDEKCDLYLGTLSQEFEEELSEEEKKIDKYSAGFMRFASKREKRLQERVEIVRSKRGQRKGTGILFAGVLAVVLLVTSYSFVVQPDYDAPGIEEDSAIYKINELSPDNAYLIKDVNGLYVIHSAEGEYPIDSEFVEFMIQDGFEVREGE